MAFELNISGRAQAELRRRATREGMDLAAYVAREVERLASGGLTLADISGPARDDFARSGMTDEEFGKLLEDAKQELRGNEDKPA